MSNESIQCVCLSLEGVSMAMFVLAFVDVGQGANDAATAFNIDCFLVSCKCASHYCGLHWQWGAKKTGETHGTSVDSPPDSAVGVFSSHVLALKGLLFCEA